MQSNRMHQEAERAMLSRPVLHFNASASESLRVLWPGMNAALTVAGGKHARVIKRVRVGQDRPWQRSGRAQTRDDVR